MSSSTLEKMRKFERRCLRVCLHVFRKNDSDEFFSSKTIYSLANIPRIDNFLLRINRDYFAQLKSIDNSYLKEFSQNGLNNYSNQALSNYKSPFAFMYFDKLGYLQNKFNIPIFYHVPRNQASKTINWNPADIHRRSLKYSTTTPDRDINEFYILNFRRYW
ncbi:hypothetical protein M0804_006510 [Polistes exclamans]|nr:hypothetical protein M0804_006510 [Polistes exclamans]